MSILEAFAASHEQALAVVDEVDTPRAYVIYSFIVPLYLYGAAQGITVGSQVLVDLVMLDRLVPIMDKLVDCVVNFCKVLPLLFLLNLKLVVRELDAINEAIVFSEQGAVRDQRILIEVLAIFWSLLQKRDSSTIEMVPQGVSLGAHSFKFMLQFHQCSYVHILELLLGVARKECMGLVHETNLMLAYDIKLFCDVLFQR